jgi:hypothetical protein
MFEEVADEFGGDVVSAVVETATPEGALKDVLAGVDLGGLAGRVGIEIPARAVGGLRSPAGAVLAVNVLVWTVPMAAVVAYLGTGAVTDAGLWTRVRSLLDSTDYWKGALWWLVVPATEDHRGTVERREDGRNARVTN